MNHPADGLLKEWVEYWKNDSAANHRAQSTTPLEILSLLGTLKYEHSYSENTGLPLWLSHLNSAIEKAQEKGYKWVSIHREYFNPNIDITALTLEAAPRTKPPEKCELEFRLFGIDGSGVETAISGPASIMLGERRVYIDRDEIVFIETPKGIMLFYSVLYLEPGWKNWKILECRAIPQGEANILYEVRNKL